MSSTESKGSSPRKHRTTNFDSMSITRSNIISNNVTKSISTLYILGTAINFDFHPTTIPTAIIDHSLIKSNNINAVMTMTTTITNNSTTTSYVNDNGSDSEYDLINDHQQKQRSSSNILGKSLCCSSCLGVVFDDRNIDAPSMIEGTAFDVIVVEGQDGKLFQNSDFLVSFKGKGEDNNNNNNNNNYNNENNAQRIVMELDQDDNNPTSDIDGTTTKAWFPIQPKHSSNTTDSDSSSDFDEKRFWGCCHPVFGSAKPNMLSNLSDGGGGDDDENNNNDDPSFALKAFLKPGRNKMRYLLLDDQRIIGVAHAYIFLWNYQDSVVVSDIDGTITKSNARGVLGTIVTKQYVRVCHVGICHLLSSLSSSSQIVYVTSRPLSLASQTRQFLSNLRQGNETLPHGPLLGFEGKMSQLVVMELLSKTTQKFKSGKLWKQVVQPFRRATNDPKTPFFVTGIGNTIMDVQGKDYF